MVSTRQLEEGKITSLIMRFSGPAIVGMIVTSIYNVVDRIYIGQGVGTLALAGVTVGFPVMLLIMALTSLVGVGATSLISIRFGEKKKDEAERIMGNALVLLVILAVVISVLGLVFLDFLLLNFGATEQTLPYAREYMRIIFAGIIFQVISLGVNNFIRAEGNPKTAMITMVIGAIINVVLDPVFIFGFKMGVGGAALVTVFSQAVSTLWVLHYFFRGNSLLKFRRENLRLRLHWVLNIVSVGLPAFSKQISTSLSVVILNNVLLKYGGDLAISAFGVSHSVSTLLMMPIFGISQGIQPIIGYNYGAKQFERVKKTLYYGIAMATVICLAGFAGISLFAKQLVLIFNSSPELLAMGSKALRINHAMLPILGFTIVGSNYFQAVGKPREAVVLNLARQVLLLIPLYFILSHFFMLDGVWAAKPAADGITALLTAGTVFREVRCFNQTKAEADSRHQREQAKACAGN
ncbi:MAG: MATE family efflux transporter [Bacillota bacterium]|nr:MATE family efflux transporter [Bacillota bacterium]